MVGVDLALAFVAVAAVSLVGLPLFVGEVVLLAVPVDASFAGRPRFFAEDGSALFTIAAPFVGRPLFFEGVSTASLLALSWAETGASLAVRRPFFLDADGCLFAPTFDSLAGRPRFFSEDA